MAVSFKVLRLSADSTGESYFDSFDVSCLLKDFAPPAPPLFVSPVEKSSGYVMMRLPPGWGVGNWHPSPHPQILFCLSGTLRVTASNGDVRLIKAGHAWLMTDTNGKGHKTEVISDEPVDAVVVLLADAAAMYPNGGPQ
jgi:quercetin dioxygenase-like cupin family protein